MTTYTAIADSEIDPESAGTTTLFTKLRNNPLAQFEKAAGAPVLADDYIVTAMIGDGEVTFAKLPSYTAGSYIDGWYLTETALSIGTSYAKFLEIKVSRGGTVTVRMGGAEANLGHNNRMKIYVNGVAAGTERIPSGAGTWNWWNENIAVSAGDLIQVYAYETGSAIGLQMALAILCDQPTSSGALYTDIADLNL
ncbi:MAG: hypothetical protein OQK75_11560 [Gammaproteobacteria bacterium]|nr:hypothetical protein [Gammaproteobacteria bacterium]